MPDLFLRSFEPAVETEAVRALGVSFSTRRVFRVERSAETLRLSAIALEADIEKRFPVALDASGWTNAWIIAEGDAPRGFIATAVSSWNKRLSIREFFVDRPHRRRGFGRLLLERALANGVRMGMTTAFVETSNLNHPGALAYQRLGFELCGFDVSLYADTPCSEEFALFLSREIGGGAA